MEKTCLRIFVEHAGEQYTGWATPSDKRHRDGYAKSYHVVLNGVFFGALSFQDGRWTVSEQRPHDLFVTVGSAIAQVEGPTIAKFSTRCADR
jgi:hypothetical protein